MTQTIKEIHAFGCSFINNIIVQCIFVVRSETIFDESSNRIFRPWNSCKFSSDIRLPCSGPLPSAFSQKVLLQSRNQCIQFPKHPVSVGVGVQHCAAKRDMALGISNEELRETGRSPEPELRFRSN